MGTDGWRSGTSPSSGSRDLQQSHNHPDTQKQPCVGSVGSPIPKHPSPIRAPWAHRGPLLLIHRDPSTHGSASQGCILCILLSKAGGGEDAGTKSCRTDLCLGPENGSKLQSSRKRKKKINHRVSSSIRSWEQTDSCHINMSQPGKRRGNIFISSIR